MFKRFWPVLHNVIIARISPVIALRSVSADGTTFYEVASKQDGESP
jgi:hypothetical protein